ncbi:glycosyltransferase family 4 protein [Roseofilum capinflatum]|uniref:Glycosyltransferase family 4 protein n=1 Tax=Roseofilum capinflatum BLCC-M114 TaxID=3022440 RepID=A0ABT7B0N4_9CYAN|nr:glycosyltransferase family 4 protein [Roseofilum capinflatum]MDJ1172685.1 glycosyltransferase family 4 protein [Roseofilum capinflatum BLCC-M114]
MNNKLTVTIFYQFNPWKSSIGGIQSVICNFIKYAPPEFEVRLVGTGEDAGALGKWQDREFAGRALQFMPVIPLEEDNVRRWIPTTLKYTQALMGKDFSSDFMHFHRIEPTLVAGKWQGEKALFIHNDIQQQMKSTTGKKALLWQYFPGAYFVLENRLMQGLDRLYSCNTESTNFYQERYPDLSSRVQGIRNPVDLERFYPLEVAEKKEKRKDLAEKMNLSPDTRFILFAGRLHPQKDPLLLVQTVGILKEANIHLLVAGEGELRPELESEIKRLDLSTKITLLGAVPQEQLVKYHQLSSACILTSVYEGLPIVVLEALSCGIPVVSTACGETPRILIPGSGEVSATRSPEAIAEALRMILKDPDQYSPLKCVQAVQLYDAEIVVNRVYEEMKQRWITSKKV